MRILLATFFVFLAGSGAASAGGCTSTCGGNWSAAEFYNIANDALEALGDLQAEEKLDLGKLPYVKENGTTARLPVSFRDKHTAAITESEITANVNDLSDAFRLVSLSSDQLLIEGRPVDFRSAPSSGVVEFTEESWNKQRSARERLQLVIHELLMLAKKKNPEVYDDYNYRYQLSRRLADHALARMEQRERGASGDAEPNPCPEIPAREDQALGAWIGSVDDTLLAARAKEDAAKPKPVAEPAPEKKSAATFVCTLTHYQDRWFSSLSDLKFYVEQGSDETFLKQKLTEQCLRDYPHSQILCRTTAICQQPDLHAEDSQICEIKPLFGGQPAVGISNSMLGASAMAIKRCMEESFFKERCFTAISSILSKNGTMACRAIK